MRTMHISTAVIEQNGCYLLQKRRSDPSKGAAGLVATFGGQIEPGEKSADTCCREIGEETNLNLSPNNLTYLGSVTVESDHSLEVVKIIAEVYYVIIDPAITVQAKEGELVMLAKTAILDEKQLSPATKACFEELI
jgi:8-oxo-dGTP pyrophosphatase MutT (NUDIX family)